MAAAAAAADAASQASIMTVSQFERFNGRPMSTSAAVAGRATITFVQPISKVGITPSGTFYTGKSSLINKDSGFATQDWGTVSSNGEDVPWRYLSAFGMNGCGLTVAPQQRASAMGTYIAASACGMDQAVVNHWAAQGAMNWTMFPVVFKVPGAFAVVPFVCMISTVRPTKGPQQPGMEGGREPVWRSIPTMISPAISFMVDSSHVNFENWDAQMSIVAALNVYFPRSAAPGQYYLLLQPYGEPSQVRAWQVAAGINRSTSASEDYVHLSAHGASLGLAVAACCAGLSSFMYTGYTSNIARRLTLPSRKAKFNSNEELIGGLETAGTSDWVETVQDVDFKIGWAFANQYPIVIPMVDALTSLNMAQVMRNLTRAYSVYYPPPKGSGTLPTTTSTVWGGPSVGTSIAQTLGQYAMFANNPDLTIYTAADVFGGDKYVEKAGVILSAGSISEALLVTVAAVAAYITVPKFDARNNLQDRIWKEVEPQLVAKVNVLDKVDAEKKVQAKAKREANKAAGIKPKKAVPKPKRVAPKTAAELREYRSTLTKYAKETGEKRKATRAASVAKGSAARAKSAAPVPVVVDGSQTAIRNAPGVSKDLAYAQMLQQFLTEHAGQPYATNAEEYYQVMGTTHDAQRSKGFGRTGVVRFRPGYDLTPAQAAAADALQVPIDDSGIPPTRMQSSRMDELGNEYDEEPDVRQSGQQGGGGLPARTPEEFRALLQQQRVLDQAKRNAVTRGRGFGDPVPRQAGGGGSDVAGTSSGKYAGSAAGGKFTNAQYLRAQGVNPL